MCSALVIENNFFILGHKKTQRKKFLSHHRNKESENAKNEIKISLSKFRSTQHHTQTEAVN